MENIKTGGTNDHIPQQNDNQHQYQYVKTLHKCLNKLLQVPIQRDDISTANANAKEAQGESLKGGCQTKYNGKLRRANIIFQHLHVRISYYSFSSVLDSIVVKFHVMINL